MSTRTGSRGPSERATASTSASRSSRRPSPGSRGRSGGGGNGSGKGRGGTGRRAPVGRDRFEARRLAAERSDGLRRLRLVLGLAAVTSLAVGVVAFINSSWFDVDTVEVVGNERAGADSIVTASGIRPGQGLLEVDLERAQRQVELVPWVGTAEVTRSWSGRIEIAVIERPASTVIPAGDGFALVDDHGRQLEVVDQRPDGYLPVRGIEGSGVAGEPAPDEILPVVALADALGPELADRVAAIVVVDGDIHLELVDGGRGNLGRGDDLGAKLQSFETVLARVDLTCLDTIDVRVPAAPVVTRTAEPPAADDAPTGTAAEGTVRDTGSEEPDSVPADC